MADPYRWIIPLLSGCISLVLGSVVLRANKSARANRIFALLATSVALWNFTIFLFLLHLEKDLTLQVSKFLRVGTLTMPTLAFHLAVEVFGERRRGWRAALWMSYAAAAVFVMANFLGLFVSDLRSYRWGYYSVATPFYSAYTSLCVVNSVATAVLLVIGFRTAKSPRQRLVVKFWLLGAAVILPLSLTNLLPVYGIEIIPLGSAGNVMFSTIVAYAIVRHRLMDIDVVITKGMAYAAVSLMIVAPAFGVTLWLERFSFGRTHAGLSVGILIMFIAVGLLFPALRLRAESRIERSLFREKHGSRAALSAFTRSIVRILDRERLVRELGTTLSESLHLDRLAVALFDRTRRVFAVRYEVGAPAADAELPPDHNLLAILRKREQAVQRWELESSNDEADRSAGEMCGRNGWEVCVPLMLGEELLGFIGLGGKRNLEAFYAEDLELLETLAAEAAVALENARLYEELKKSQDIIRRADRLSALGTLAAGIAHEVRNPLVSIQTFFQLAPERLHDQEFFTTFLGMTTNEVKRISDLITELLSFARSSTHSLGAVNLNEVVERVATLLEPEARKHKLTLTRTLSPNVPLVNADGDQIKQVLINLVLNAIQATRSGGVVEISTRSVDHQNGAFGQIEIRDTGVGIPPDQLEHIFDPFFTTKDKGTGLGLAIAHQIITEHGGSVTVESREGHGTSFFVNLPPYGAASRSSPPEAQTHMDALPVDHTPPRRVASA